MKIIYTSKMSVEGQRWGKKERGRGREHIIVIEKGRHRQTWLPREKQTLHSQ